MSLTSSHGAGTVITQDHQILLVSMNYGKFKGQWVLPGGMVEEGEWPIDAAIREAFEETGQKIKSPSPLAVRHRKVKGKTDNVFWVFQFELRSPSPLMWPKEEIIEAKYWHIDELLMSPTVRPHTKIYVSHAFKLKNSELLTKAPFWKESLKRPGFPYQEDQFQLF